MAQKDGSRTRVSTRSSPRFQRAVTILFQAIVVSIAIMFTTTVTFAITAIGADHRRGSSSSPTGPAKLRSISWSPYDNSNSNDSDKEHNAAVPSCQKIREALSSDYPELEALCSDAYLESVAGVPGRSLDYAIDHTIKRQLDWRRSYEVESLRRAFETVGDDCGENRGDAGVPTKDGEPQTQTPAVVLGRTFVPCHNNPDTMGGENENENENGFVPSPKLVKVCSSGAFVVLDEELVMTRGEGEEPSQALEHENGTVISQRRLVVYADTSKLNWWKTGITAGFQYHVLVLEEALARIRKNKNTTRDGPGLEESLVLCVDTTAPPRIPPPLGVLKGMARLLQKAYPDRIHKIYVGPVSPWLRALYRAISPFLKPRSRNKIVLLGEAPSAFFLNGGSRD